MNGYLLILVAVIVIFWAIRLYQSRKDQQKKPESRRSSGISAMNDLPMGQRTGGSPGYYLALKREAAGEYHQCPACNSRRWAVYTMGERGYMTLVQPDGIEYKVPDKGMIQCVNCHTVGTDNTKAQKIIAERGFFVNSIADFDLKPSKN